MAQEEGDLDFEALYRAEVDRLVRMAYLMCGDAGSAEDAVSVRPS